MEQALEFVTDFRGRAPVTVVHRGSRHWEIFIQLCRNVDVRGNPVPDAYHAALAMEFGLEWITLDRGFSRYPGLRWSSLVA